MTELADFSLNVVGGGGTPTAVVPTITAQPVALMVNEGLGATFSVTATGTAPLVYQWRKDATPLAGGTAATLVLSSVTSTSAGTYSVTISNAAGSVTSTGALLSVKSVAVSVPPQITVQPRDVVTTTGVPVSLSVTATGTAPFIYQWRKGGLAIDGATAATLTLAGQAADAGTYTVTVSNAAGAVTSASATVTLSSTALPVVIVTHPLTQIANAGGSVSFSVVATGTGGLTYQWQKDGVPIAGATSATLSLTNLAASAAGTYRVVVSSGGSNATSNGATLSVQAAPNRSAVGGTYFGSFGGNGGVFALLVRDDRSGVFLGYASAARLVLLSRDVIVAADGTFAVTQPDMRAPAANITSATPPTAAHEGEFHLAGTIAADGSLAGTVSGLTLTFSAPPATSSGPTAAQAGYYQAGAIGNSAQSYAIVSPANQVLVVNVNGTTADGGTGTMAANGAVTATTVGGATVTGAVSAEARTISTTVTSNAGASLAFVGASDTRTDTEKLINISTRSQTGTTANTLIAGFVVSGDAAKPVLIRAIGPTLGTAFGVGGALSAARLEIFRGQTSLAVGNDWGTPAAGAPSAASIVAATARVGAFGLPANSRDAALLLNLEPGAYSAVVTGQGGVSGVSLVEVYDATEGPIPRDRRIINIATRATAGIGDNALIAGFYVSGTVPKRLLIRGVGPALTQFGLGGVLARPQLTVNSGATILAQNAGWSASSDATLIAASSAQVGALALPANSADAALIVHLAPGAYTAQVAGVGNTTGVALIEVYELP